MIRRLPTDRENWGDVAIIEDGKAASYRDLARKALAIQRLLPRGRAENVAILLPNGGNYVAAFYGVVMSGMPALPLHALMTKHEIFPLLAQASVRTVVSSEAFRPVFADAAGDGTPDLNVIYVEQLPAYHGDELPALAAASGDEQMVLLGTSGTTGKSKIVRLSENNVQAAVLGYIDKMDFSGIEGIRFVLGVPFSSAYGMMILSVCLMHSFPIVAMNGGFTLDAFYRTVEADGAITGVPHTRGEIVVRGPNVMLGYYNDREETDKVLKNGYLYTGDIGYLDEDGDLYICGRKKNIIIVRGFNVHPEEVEECILNSALAADCRVYGRTDASGNEIICADVVPTDPQVGERDIRAFCFTHLAEYKQPQTIRICDEIGKTAAGKTGRA